MRRVGFQVLMAFAASLVVINVLLQLSGTTDAVLQGLSSSAQLAAALSTPEDPIASPLIQQIFEELSADPIYDAQDSLSFSLAYEGHTISNGDFVPMLKAASAPTVSISVPDANDALYTWILIDVDAPSPLDPSHSPFLHAIVANIDPDHDIDPLQVVSYFPVTPPIGDHRYVSLVFSQGQVESQDDARLYEAALAHSRSKFDVVEYARRHHLQYQARSYFFSQPAQGN